ncbi:MAG: 50S ribosomal protein L23 [Succinivibrionaceae bacterium]|nr:50S ribosomal protein L23 [Succinivibrionaceae bacterium]
MNRQEYLLDVIKSNIFSEKAYNLGQNETLVLRVLPKASKKDIRDAVKFCLGFEVERVNTLNVLGKSRRTRYRLGKRQDWKKAYVKVRVPEGQTMEDVAKDLGKAGDN